MASSASANQADLGEQPSAAQKLLQQHNDHHTTIEDVPDEDLKKHETETSEPSGADAGPTPTWAPTMSAKAAGKQKAQEPSAKLDTQSHELFPELGGPKKGNAAVVPTWGVKNGANGKTNGATATNGGSRASTPGSGVATPAVSGRKGPPNMSIPGRNVEHVVLEPAHIMPRNQMKRPIPDVIKDVNRRSRANVSMVQLPGGKTRFEATGPQDLAQQALKDLVQQIGAKHSVKVPIPSSARAHIIGKQGSTIKSIQEKTGARIQLPKVEDAPYPVDDDDESTIDVLVEGNALSAAAARDEILRIAGERTANLNTRMRGIPPEFLAFLGENDFVSRLENGGVQMRVPPHQPWSSQPPAAPEAGQRPVFGAAGTDGHIQLAGDRAAVQAAKAQIERRVAELHRELVLKQQGIPKGLHQFIIGDRGMPMEDFFSQTGCVIILPTDEDDDVVTLIGPAAAIDQGMDTATDLADQMKMTNCDISRVHRQAPGGAGAHARNVTRYLRARKEIDRLEKHYGTHINTPFTNEGAQPWEFYSRDAKRAYNAQTELKAIVGSHPPSRMASVPVDDFFHKYLRDEVNPRVRQEHGVYLIVPDASDATAPVLLVYEAPGEAETPYQVPQNQPSAAEVKAFQQGIQDAQKYVLDLLKQQGEITKASLEVPAKFHDKLKRFIKQETQRERSANEAPIRVFVDGTTITLRGPEKAVQSMASKVDAFITQEKEDEKERGFTLSFEFPQKFANHLIGKGGSHIRELRDKFDVDIQVQDGMVELKGPKAKAEACRTHINAMARQLADETSHTLKIEPKFHRELIGAQGATINRLQTRYKVQIFFPRSAKSAKDDESNADAASEAGKGRRQQAPDEVMVRGPRKGADEARDEILTLFQYLKDNAFTASVALQQKQLPYLIGQGGSAMEALRQQTGAKIDIPNARDAPEAMVEVQIKGTKAQVAAAKKVLEEKKAVFDDTVVKSIEVEKKYHRALIGTGGSNIRDMILKAGGSDDRRELSRTMQFPKQEADGNTIKIEGRKSVVDSIVAQIEAFVSQRESQATEVVEVPVDKHRSLIGRGGDAKRQIESQFHVTLEIPRQGSGETSVRITGQPADVKLAQAHIAEKTKEQHGETVQVPRSMHHAISNGGQFFRRMRGDHHVTIDHAGQTVPPRPSAASGARATGGALPLITDDADADVHSWNVVESAPAEEGEIAWVLRGSPENVDKAKKALEAAMEQAKASGVVGYLVLPDPGTYRYVIGHAGRKIDSIRKQSGCRINVPHGNSGDGAIEVMGTKEGVEKAKDLILAAVRDGSKARE